MKQIGNAYQAFLLTLQTSNYELDVSMNQMSHFYKIRSLVNHIKCYNLSHSMWTLKGLFLIRGFVITRTTLFQWYIPLFMDGCDFVHLVFVFFWSGRYGGHSLGNSLLPKFRISPWWHYFLPGGQWLSTFLL